MYAFRVINGFGSQHIYLVTNILAGTERRHRYIGQEYLLKADPALFG